MRLSEMKHVLETRSIHLTKSLGQNFLHDGNQLRRIVQAAELAKSDRVLEVGPGLGPLTELLLEEGATVLAIEKDERLVHLLEERFATERRLPDSSQTGERRSGGLQLLHDDALDYLRRQPRDWTGWKLVANLPYSVASPLLVELAQSRRGPDRMVATLQVEVARRLVAQAGDPDYGLLTLLLQLEYEPRGSFKIPAGCFFPPPEVDSTCVCLVRRAQPLLRPELHPAFSRIAKRGFSQRRKMLLKLLRADWPGEKLDAAFAQLNISPQIRAERLTLEQFVRLTELLVEL